MRYWISIFAAAMGRIFTKGGLGYLSCLEIVAAKWIAEQVIESF
jgi:hypothetical protein